jgi:hypothetical protein
MASNGPCPWAFARHPYCSENACMEAAASFLNGFKIPRIGQIFCDHVDVRRAGDGRLWLECLYCGRTTEGIAVTPAATMTEMASAHEPRHAVTEEASISGHRRLHRTSLGVVDSRAFQLERDTFRAEIQREGEPLAGAPSAVHGTLQDAWQWAERVVQTRYPHDCEAMHCGQTLRAAG